MFLALVFLNLVVSVNRPPIITVKQGAEPIVRNSGTSIELPIHVCDPDGDGAMLFYKFDDGHE
jgi:hypothetical protein